jgi:hypothetical protein
MAWALGDGVCEGRRGRAEQVYPINHTLKAPGFKCLKLEYDELLSSFAFKFNSRRFNEVDDDNDGVADVAQMTKKQLVVRKMGVVAKAGPHKGPNKGR